jgi:hypothetical protein
VNAKTKEQSKFRMHANSPYKLKKFKETFFCQNPESNCFLEQERGADGGIRATGDHNNVRSVF